MRPLEKDITRYRSNTSTGQTDLLPLPRRTGWIKENSPLIFAPQVEHLWEGPLYINISDSLSEKLNLLITKWDIGAKLQENQPQTLIFVALSCKQTDHPKFRANVRRSLGVRIYTYFTYSRPMYIYSIHMPECNCDVVLQSLSFHTAILYYD